VQFALASDLSGLAPVNGFSWGVSRVLYRTLIAWMHLIYPIARMRGRIKGLSSMPHANASAPEHIMRRPWQAPVPRLRDLWRSILLAVGRPDRRDYWSETWLDHAHLLGELVGIVRAARPAPVVEVDEGWRPDRDFSIGVGGWGWLHVQALVEEHAKGACLMRVRSRLRVSFIGMFRGLAIIVGLIGAVFALKTVQVPSGGVLPGVLLALLAFRVGWQATQGVAVFDRALARVVQDAGMMPLPRTRTGVRPPEATVAPPGAAESYNAAPGR
jgi:hypothetical protein